LPNLGISGRHVPLKIAEPTKQGSPHHWKFPKVRAGPRFTHGFQSSLLYDYITKLGRRQAELIQNLEKEHFRCIGQGEARHRKYKSLKLGGGQVTKLPL
jgi:hypothetical protein